MTNELVHDIDACDDSNISSNNDKKLVPGNHINDSNYNF